MCYAIKTTHRYISFELLVSYLAIVCCVQCVLAVLIYNIPVFQTFVDTYIDQGQEFLLEVNRLYGIGASLDNAGVRFSVVLLAIMAIVVHSKMVRDSWSWLLLLLVSFIIIGVIGNMISRTTTIGLALSLVYFLIFSNVFKLKIQLKDLGLYFKLLLLLLIAIVIVVYYYKYNAVFHSQIRFAFEGFFNWLEVGEWRTDSTDKLNANMWIWPNDTKTWIIGTGLFADWIYNTDVGYCRIILYSGLIGFSTFSMFFVYNAVVFIKALPKYRSLFIGFLILTFIIWIKVSTDIFFIYALFYSYLMLEDQIEKHTEYENSLLHPGNV